MNNLFVLVVCLVLNVLISLVGDSLRPWLESHDVGFEVG